MFDCSSVNRLFWSAISRSRVSSFERNIVRAQRMITIATAQIESFAFIVRGVVSFHWFSIDFIKK